MLIARRMESSMANGPGKRAVVWVQGCDARCPGCCNPELQPMESEAAVETTPERLSQWFLRAMDSDPGLRGLSFSGGEPLHPRHFEELTAFIGLCRRNAPRPIDVMSFTGYTLTQLVERFGFEMNDLLAFDMLIAGPYDRTRNNPRGIVASLNQRILRFSDAFSDIDDDTLINGTRIIEVRLVSGGTVTVTGISSIDETREVIGL